LGEIQNVFGDRMGEGEHQRSWRYLERDIEVNQAVRSAEFDLSELG